MATGIYKRSNVWWIRYTGIDGRQKRESSHSKEYKAAVSVLADRQKSISVGKEPEIKRIPNYTFRELAEKYKAWIEGRQNSAKTKGYIIGQLLSVFGDIQLKRFNMSSSTISHSTALLNMCLRIFRTLLLLEGLYSLPIRSVCN